MDGECRQKDSARTASSVSYAGARSSINSAVGRCYDKGSTVTIQPHKSVQSCTGVLLEEDGVQDNCYGTVQYKTVISSTRDRDGGEESDSKVMGAYGRDELNGNGERLLALRGIANLDC